MRTLFVLLVMMALIGALSGCGVIQRRQDTSAQQLFGGKKADKRLASIALEMLDPGKRGFDPDKGKTYLEYSLKHGSVSSVDVPASVLLELLKSEKVAVERSRSLEQQLEIMKAIDMESQGEHQ